MTKCLGWLNRWATSFRWISPSFSPSLGNALYKTLCGLDKSFYHLLVERATSKLIKRHVMGITDILHCQVAHSIFHTMNVPLAMVRKTGRPYSKVLLSSFPTIIYHCLQSYMSWTLILIRGFDISSYNNIWAEHCFLIRGFEPSTWGTFPWCISSLDPWWVIYLGEWQLYVE